LREFLEWNASHAKIAQWSATVTFGSCLRSKDFHMKINMSSTDYVSYVNPEAKSYPDKDWAQHDEFRRPVVSLVHVDDFGSDFTISRPESNFQSSLVFAGRSKKPTSAADLTMESFRTETSFLCDAVQKWAASKKLTGFWMTLFSPESLIHSGASQSFFVIVDLENKDYRRLCSVPKTALGRTWSNQSRTHRGRKYIAGKPHEL
jgi:hypothetical protein